MNNILFFILDGYADWESGFASAKLNKPDEGYAVHTISVSKAPVISQGNFFTNIDYSIDTFEDFGSCAALLLIGGTGWGTEHLIKGYDLSLYNSSISKKITTFINYFLENKILVGAICDGATFMADNGYLDNISHTGNSLSHLKEKAPKYNGEWLFKEKQAIYDNNIITANGTAPLEFVREILLALNMLGGKNKVDEWYNLYKQGTFQS
ncbi:DJ-1/PfpI family protein [Pectinatus frisingensis]|uniref:DJ-1/PfpI family protein n=1 Tax=Pectinatus frisingensis TaxID=865 RepID=UPI0018C7860A|nr:DJ-1/PfpI family protein [Pectinatus frisingensis]